MSSKLTMYLTLTLAVGCKIDAGSLLDPVADGQVRGDDAGDAQPSEHPSSHEPRLADAAPDGDPINMDDGRQTGPRDGGPKPGKAPVLDAGMDGMGPDDGEEEDNGGADAGSSSPDGGMVGVDPELPVPVPNLGPANMADAERAGLIYALLRSEGYVENWTPAAGSSGQQRPLLVSPSHGSEVRVRENPVARRASEQWSKAGRPLPLKMPNGAIFAKDMFKLDPMSGLTAYNGTLVMAKIDALDPNTYAGNWFFVRVSKNQVSGEYEANYASTCVDCHNGRTQKVLFAPDGKPDALKDYDYLYAHFCADPASAGCSSSR